MRSHTLNSINETQKSILQSIFKFYFDEFAELPSENEMKALEAITVDSISPEQISLFETLKVWSTIQEIKNLLAHPCPQNRTESHIYAGKPHDNNFIAYENSQGLPEFERKGLLNLTQINDNTAAPITREATINYINFLIEQAKKDCLRRKEDPNPRRQSFADGYEVGKDKSAVTVAKSKVDGTIALFIEGMRKNGQAFVDCYQLYTNQHDFYPIAKSIVPTELIVSNYDFQSSTINGLYHKILKRIIEEKITKSTKEMDFSLSDESSVSIFPQNNELSLEWISSLLEEDEYIVNDFKKKFPNYNRTWWSDKPSRKLPPIIWNPLAHLQETTKYPLARLTRSSFDERMMDTFRIFYGDFFTNRMGILDYIYPLSRISTDILVKMNFKAPQEVHFRMDPTVSRILLTLVWAAITLVLSIPKLIIASALTLIASPFTAIAHFYLKPRNEKMINDIEHLKINLYRTDTDKHLNDLDETKDISEEKDLIQVIPRTDFDSLSIRPIVKFSDGTSATYGEYSKTDPVHPRLLLLGLFSIKSKGNSEPQNLLGKPLAMIKLTPQNITPIKALLATNSFWATTHLETAEALPVLEAEMDRLQSNRLT